MDTDDYKRDIIVYIKQDSPSHAHQTMHRWLESLGYKVDFNDKLIQEIGDEITKLRKENNELKEKLSSNAIYGKLNEYCKIRCNEVCKKSEKELKEDCLIKGFINYLKCSQE